jgi:iron(III) transport system substrate-binding protein
MKKLLIVLLCLAVIPVVYGADTARAEGKASFYANITAVEPVMEAFNKSGDVEGVYTRISTSKYLATILTEFEAGKLTADVLQSPLPIMETLKAKGVFVPYKSPSSAGYPDWATKDDTITQFGIEYVAPLYNKELVKPADAPKSYMDLTDPKWKDKIVMPNPSTHATTISWLVGLKEAKMFGDDAGWAKFVKGLAANNPMFVKSFGPSPGPIESGEKLVGISMPKYIITHAPAPLDWVRVDTILGTPRGIAISANAPNPESAKKFMDYWLSKDAMQILANKVGEYVLTPGVKSPIDGMDKAKVMPIRSLSNDEIKEWGVKFKKMFEM